MGTCRSLFSTRACMLHCLRYTRAHVALSSLRACACCTVFATRVPMFHCLRYTRAFDAQSSLHTRTCCAFKLNTRAVPLNVSRYFAAFITEKCLPHLCLKIHLSMYKLTLFSCSADISLFTRSFLASNLSALMNMFCLWVSKSTSRAAVDCTSRLGTKMPYK